jgi:two-component system, LytTR family, response regulator LytT
LKPQMPAVKIGIVEDEMIIAENLRSVLLSLQYDVPEPALGYEEAISMIGREKPDLLLLDVNLNEKRDGIDLAHHINQTWGIPFIFLTANADAATVSRAKFTRPPAYLVKPFSKEELFAAIEICLHNFQQKNERAETGQNKKAESPLEDALFIKEGNYFHKVKFSDILYLESEHVYVMVHTLEKKILVRSSMQDYLSKFDPREFIRIHRSFAVSLRHLQSINTDHVMVNNRSLPVSKQYREALFSRVKLG